MPGIAARSITYLPLLSKGSSIPIIEKGASVFYLSHIKCSKGVYIDENTRVHASVAAIELGENCRVMYGAYLCSFVSDARKGEGIVTGANCWIGINAVIASGQGGIFMGDNVLIGPNAAIVTGRHDFEKLSLKSIEQDYSGLPITIGNDVWIGANVTILGGVTIGERAVIGAGSVVTKDVEPFTVVGGIPATFIKKIE